MTRRTRLFVGGAVAVLAVGLGVGAAVSQYGPTRAPFGPGGPPELRYVPGGARVVAFASVRDVVDSELHRRLAELRTGDPPVPDRQDVPGAHRDFLAQTGIDVERDVDRIVACFAGDGTESDGDPALVLARGRFDDDLIETLIRQRGGGVEEHRGVRLVTYAEDDRMLATAFVEPDLMAFGTAAMVREAIDVSADGGGITDDEEVMALIRDIDRGDVWAVGRFDEIASRGVVPGGVASQLPPITWLSATAQVNGGVSGVIRAETRDEAAAVDLRQVVQGFLALVRLQAAAHPGIAGLMNSLELGDAGRSVSLAFAIPPAAVDALAALRDRRPPAADRRDAVPAP